MVEASQTHCTLTSKHKHRGCFASTVVSEKCRNVSFVHVHAQFVYCQTLFFEFLKHLNHSSWHHETTLCRRNQGRFDIYIADIPHGSVSSILSVLGSKRNKMLSVFMVRKYCLPSMMYGSEIWHTTDNNLTSLDIARNNAFRKIFNGFWRESVKTLLFYCKCLPLTRSGQFK